MSRFVYTSDEGLVLLYNRNKTEEIVNYINNDQVKIIRNIQESSIAVYDFLSKEFTKGNIKSNLIFQFLFSAFYGLNNAGLQPEFKDLYFSILDSYKDKTHFELTDFKDVLLKLSVIKNRKGQNNVQFSFTTKMFHTVDNTLPIYDNEVASLFGLNQPYQEQDYDKKINIYIKQYELLKYTYDKIINENMIKSTVDLFNSKFGKYSISETKIHDFIFWTAGKIKSKRDPTSVKVKNQTYLITIK